MSRNGSYLSADLSRVLEEYGFEENEDDDDVTTGSESASKDPETSGAEVFDGEFISGFSNIGPSRGPRV